MSERLAIHGGARAVPEGTIKPVGSKYSSVF
jgi:hypothetical protein